MNTIHVNSVILEITRMCNMCCWHCLRGQGQYKNIDPHFVEQLFMHIDSIGTLTFSGGEPFLHPEIIQQVLEIAKVHEVEIQNFYIATNGLIRNDDVLMTILKCFQACTDNEISMVKVSMDQFHKEAWETDQTQEIKQFFKPFSFVECNEKELKLDYLYAEGNLEGTCCTTRKVDIPKELEMECWCEKEDVSIIIENDIYLNVHGKILLACDLSYENQDKPKNQFCDVYNFMDKIDAAYCKQTEEQAV